MSRMNGKKTHTHTHTLNYGLQFFIFLFLFLGSFGLISIPSSYSTPFILCYLGPPVGVFNHIIMNVELFNSKGSFRRPLRGLIRQSCSESGGYAS